MPATEGSSNSGNLNGIFVHKSPAAAKTLHEVAAKAADSDELQHIKSEIFTASYRILTIHLGTPATSVD